MLTLKERTHAEGALHGDLVLPYDLREKSRLKAKLASGEDVALFLPRGTVLRGGDRLRSDDGKLVRVVAAPEKIYSVECHEPAEFARVAFHLGNRHTAVQIVGDVDGHLVLRIRADSVLKEMLEGLGAHVFEEEAPFEPESGAYGGGHSHSHDGHSHSHGHDHDHGHEHDPAHPGNRMPQHAPKIHRHGEPPIVKG